MTAPPTLARAAGENARWIAVGQATRIALQLAGLVVLSRLLPPSDFGLMAMVLTVCNFAALWRDLGTATALVREPVLRDSLAHSVFWLNVIVGAGVGLLLVLVREPLATAWGDARLAPLLAVVAGSFPLQGLGATHQAMMERAGRFRALAATEAASGGLGLLVAVWCGLQGWGALSLALQTLTASAASAALLWWRSRWWPRGGLQRAELRGLLHFSGHLTAFNLINYVTRNADSVIIGRWLGAAALGVYSLAMRVVLFPVQNLTWAASRAVLPLMNQPGRSAAETQALYLRGVSLIALFAAPLMAGVHALREDFVVVVLGPQWTLAPELLAWLAPVGFVQSIVSTVGPVFLARGRADLLMRLGLLSLVLIVGSFLLSVRFGVVAVAAGYLAANLLHAAPCLLLALRELNLPAAALLRGLRAPAVGAVVLVAVLAGAQALPIAQAWPAALRLAVFSVLGGTVYLATVWTTGRQTCRDALLLLGWRH